MWILIFICKLYFLFHELGFFFKKKKKPAIQLLDSISFFIQI